MNQLITKGAIYENDNLSDLVASFLSNRATTTIAAYRQDLNEFCQFLKVNDFNEGVRLLIERTHGEANMLTHRYKAYLINESMLAPATVNRRLAALRSLVHLARVMGLVTWELDIENQQSQAYRDTKGIGADGVKKILQYLADRQDQKSVRDYAVLRLLFDLGLRRQEICNIDLEDLNLAESTIAILGKGRTEKEILSLPAITVFAIKNWLAVRDSQMSALFFRLDKAKSSTTNRLTGTGLYTIMKELGAKVGINNMTVHKVRHSSITECCKVIAENKLGIETLTKFSRHKSLNTAMVYMDHLEDQQGKLADLVSKKVS